MHTQQQQHPQAHEAPQHMVALERANEVRLARAQIKRDLKAGKLTVEAVLSDPPEVVKGVSLATFLTWLPGIKRERASRIMSGLVYSETLIVGRIGEATRLRVLARIAHYQPTGRYSVAA